MHFAYLGSTGYRRHSTARSTPLRRFAATLLRNVPFRLLRGMVATLTCCYGGDEEDRTPDPLLARQVLSQLSYTPIFG